MQNVVYIRIVYAYIYLYIHLYISSSKPQQKHLATKRLWVSIDFPTASVFIIPLSHSNVGNVSAREMLIFKIINRGSGQMKYLYSTHCGLVTPYGRKHTKTKIRNNTGLCNGFVPSGTKPLHEPVLIQHQWSSAAFTCEQFRKKCTYN